MVLQEKKLFNKTRNFIDKYLDKNRLEKAIKESKKKELKELNILKWLNYAAKQVETTNESKKTNEFNPKIVLKNLNNALKTLGEYDAKKTLNEYNKKLSLIIDRAPSHILKPTIENWKKKHQEAFKTHKTNTFFLTKKYYEKYGKPFIFEKKIK